MEDSGDVVGVADDVEDAHPPAALAADGHVDGEHSSEQFGPAETARARGGRGVATVRRARAGEVEVEGELLPGRGDPRRREDASTKVVAIREHTEVLRRVNMRGRHEGAQAGEEPVRRHVGVGGPAAPGGLEEDAHAAVRAGAGIAIMIAEVGDADPGVRRVLADLPPIAIPMWLVTHRDVHTSRRVRVVVDFLAEELGDRRR